VPRRRKPSPWRIGRSDCDATIRSALPATPAA
jgi:hypothetical protein